MPQITRGTPGPQRGPQQPPERSSVLGAAVEQLLSSTVFAENAACVAAENALLPDASQLAADIAAVT